MRAGPAGQVVVGVDHLTTLGINHTSAADTDGHNLALGSGDQLVTQFLDFRQDRWRRGGGSD